MPTPQQLKEIFNFLDKELNLRDAYWTRKSLDNQAIEELICRKIEEAPMRLVNGILQLPANIQQLEQILRDFGELDFTEEISKIPQNDLDFLNEQINLEDAFVEYQNGVKTEKITEPFNNFVSFLIEERIQKLIDYTQKDTSRLDDIDSTVVRLDQIKKNLHRMDFMESKRNCVAVQEKIKCSLNKAHEFGLIIKVGDSETTLTPSEGHSVTEIVDEFFRFIKTNPLYKTEPHNFKQSQVNFDKVLSFPNEEVKNMFVAHLQENNYVLNEETLRSGPP